MLGSPMGRGLGSVESLALEPLMLRPWSLGLDDGSVCQSNTRTTLHPQFLKGIGKVTRRGLTLALMSLLLSSMADTGLRFNL